jgi:hypothetical protein
LKKRLIITTAAVAILILVMVVAACSQNGGGTTTTSKPAGGTTGKTEQPVYKVLNPQGVYIPVDCKACAPRLDSLAGKTILFYESEATNMFLPTLLKMLKEKYPTTTFNKVHTESFGEITPTDEQKKNQAVIRGTGW